MEKAITNPKLPPKAGHVEIEIDGIRQHKPTPEYLEAQAREARIDELESFIDELAAAFTEGVNYSL